MKKTLIVASMLIATAFAFGVSPQQQKKQPDKSVHHAAMHAENWVNHHASAPHVKKKHVPMKRKASKSRKPNKSVHHAAMHAEKWVDHHVSAPHKKTGQ